MFIILCKVQHKPFKVKSGEYHGHCIRKSSVSCLQPHRRQSSHCTHQQAQISLNNIIQHVRGQQY